MSVVSLFDKALIFGFSLLSFNKNFYINNEFHLLLFLFIEIVVASGIWDVNLRSFNDHLFGSRGNFVACFFFELILLKPFGSFDGFLFWYRKLRIFLALLFQALKESSNLNWKNAVYLIRLDLPALLGPNNTRLH
jgi:hypothetical protein